LHFRLPCKVGFDLLVYHTSIWFFLHLKATIFCENLKWFNFLKMKIW
jgi:hypothetical protein